MRSVFLIPQMTVVSYRRLLTTLCVLNVTVMERFTSSVRVLLSRFYTRIVYLFLNLCDNIEIIFFQYVSFFLTSLSVVLLYEMQSGRNNLFNLDSLKHAPFSSETCTRNYEGYNEAERLDALPSNDDASRI